MFSVAPRRDKKVYVSGLGDAISVASAVATTLEREGVAKIAKLETKFLQSRGGVDRGVAQVRIRLEK